MNLLKITADGHIVYPYTTLFADHPATSFPAPLSAESLPPGVRPVALTIAPPETDTHAVIELQPEQLDGVWTQRWALEPRTAADLEARAAQRRRWLTEAVQQRLDTVARSLGYDSILSACSYASSSVPQFQAEGQAATAWRDATWAAVAHIFADVASGARVEPTVPELLAELPAVPAALTVA